jgi:hypothetical protein
MKESPEFKNKSFTHGSDPTKGKLQSFGKGLSGSGKGKGAKKSSAARKHK